MNCSHSQDLLQRRLDGEAIDDRALLDQHLNTCPDCRQLHAAAQRLEEGLRLLMPPVPPASLTGAIVGRVSGDRRARLRSQRRWYVGAALAAALLIAGFAGWQGKFFRGGSESFVKNADPVVVPTKPEPTPELVKKEPDKQPAETPSLEAVFDVGTALASLGGKMANETVGQGKILLPEKMTAPALTTSPAVQPMVDPSTQSLKQAGHGITAGLSPVGTSLRRAFNLALSETSSVPEEQH